MHTLEEINKSLYRNIRSGNAYDAYMPFSDCSSTLLGYGDTGFAIKNMAKVAKRYAHHTESLSKKFFLHLSLENLCKEIHQFLFWNIQYSIDGANQLLRSPACSWASRKQGIDCKSYSIFASCILQNVGIPHYMRRIKQKSNPRVFTHVYVVVPKNNKNHKNSELKKGDYYVIDATINTMRELPFEDKDDVFIDASASGLGSPLALAFPLSSEKQRAWQNFIASVATMERLSPQNEDLGRLKAKVSTLANQGCQGVRCRIDGFAVTIDNERFTLWRPTGLGNAEVSQAIDNLLNQGQHQATALLEQSRAAGKASVINKVNAVGGAAAAVVNIVPGIGQIISLCLAAATALVSVAIMFGYDPCASRFYRTEYINENLERNFLDNFKKTFNRIETHLLGGTAPLAVSDLNKLLQEIDLGYAHFQHELKVVTDSCNQGVLAGYFDFVENIKGLVTNTLQALKINLDQHFNVSIIEKEATTNARSWFFIVPASKNNTRARYRFLNIESRNNKKGMYPYASEDNFDMWLQNNVNTLAAAYGSAVAEQYKREMLPFKEKIRAIRQNVYISVVAQVAQEDILRKQQYDIYLKYDKKYFNELIEKAKSESDAYALANISFWQELKKIRTQRLADEMRSIENMKRINANNSLPTTPLLLAGLGLTVFLLAKK